MQKRVPHQTNQSSQRGYACHRCSQQKRTLCSSLCFQNYCSTLTERTRASRDILQYLYAITNISNRKETKNHGTYMCISNSKLVVKISALRLTLKLRFEPYQQMCLKPQEDQKPIKILCGPDISPLQLLHGFVCYPISQQQRVANLLGLPAIVALNVLTKVNGIHCRENVILQIFSKNQARCPI